MIKTKKIISIALILTFLLSLAIPMHAAALSDISKLKQTDATKNSVSLRWSIVPGANLYQVQISVDNLKYYPILLTDIPNGSIPRLSPGKSYYFRVRAIRTTTGDDDDSYSKTIKAVTVPKSVTGVRQTDASENSITISWNKRSGATHYRVCKSVNGKERVVGTTKKTEYTVKGFSNKRECKTPVYVKSIRKGKSFTAEETYGVFDVAMNTGFSTIAATSIVLTPTKQTAGSVSMTSNRSVKILTQNVPFSVGSEIMINSKKYIKISQEKTKDGYVFIEKIPSNRFFKMKNRAFSIVRSTEQRKNGAWSSVTYFALGKAPTLTGGKKAVDVKWDAFSGATSYTIYATTNPLLGFRRIATTKNTSYRIKSLEGMKLTDKTTYYVYVVANKTVGKTTYQSIGNSVATVKTL